MIQSFLSKKLTTSGKPLPTESSNNALKISKPKINYRSFSTTPPLKISLKMFSSMNQLKMEMKASIKGSPGPNQFSRSKLDLSVIQSLPILTKLNPNKKTIEIRSP